MNNWLDYIDSKFSAFEILNLHQNQDGFYPNRSYKINGTYVSFEFDGPAKITKVECGKYFFENDFEYVGPVKAVLDKTKERYIAFLQLSFDGENGKQFELPYNPENKNVLDQFLKLPINEGWTEYLYKYKNSAYKVEIKLKNSDRYKVILLSTAEQDLPFPGDRLSRKVDTYFIDHLYRKKNIHIEIMDVYPIENPA